MALWVGIVSQFLPVVGTYLAGALPFVITFLDSPLPIGLSDASANELTAVPMSSSVVVNPVPTLTAAKAAESVKLSWPSWADGFKRVAVTVMQAGWQSRPVYIICAGCRFLTGTIQTTNGLPRLITLKCWNRAGFIS